MEQSKTAALLTLATALLLPTDQASAHTTVAKKNTPHEFGTRAEREGASSIINRFSIPHGCAAPGSRDFKPIRAQAVVFPNGAQAIAETGDGQEAVVLAEHITGNPIMSPKPVQDRNIFKRIKVKTGSVPAFNSHGLRNEDVRAFHFSKGFLDPQLIGLVPFRASFPTFKPESCATRLRINIAIANYCTHSQQKGNRADVWIGRLTEKYDDPDVVSVGFWPTMDVVRDLNNNPLPKHCGDGITINVYPSDASIDEYLPIKGFWPAR